MMKRLRRLVEPCIVGLGRRLAVSGKKPSRALFGFRFAHHCLPVPESAFSGHNKRPRCMLLLAGLLIFGSLRLLLARCSQK